MSRRKATILCIDDHWNGLIGRKMLLEKEGYEVLEAMDGKEGLKLFLSHAVDAVVLERRRCSHEDEALQITRSDHVAIGLRAIADEETEGGGHSVVQVAATQDSLINASRPAERPA